MFGAIKQWFGFGAAVPIVGAGRSSRWPTVRKAFLKKHPTCAACGAKTHLNVHHIKPFQHFPELELVESNLVTLCESPTWNCHLRIGHRGNWQLWVPRCVEIAAKQLTLMRLIQEEA